MPQQLRVTRELNAIGAVVMGIAPGHTGNVFYVNTASKGGNDGNAGTNYNYPKLTIKSALDACTNLNDDYIFIMDYWQASGEDWPIVINKKKVHIIGLAHSNLPFPAIHPDSDKPAFTIHENGSYCEIAYLTIGGGDSYAGISLGPVGTPGTKPEGVYIHHCTFGHIWFGTPLSGIDSPEYGAVSCRIERCTFLGDEATMGGAISGNAIDFTTTSAFHEDLEIIDNVFKGVTIGINLFKGKGAVIVGNRFAVDDTSVGEAISLEAGCVGCMVDDNHAMAGGDATMANIAYTDVAKADNEWGQNYMGVASAALPTA